MWWYKLEPPPSTYARPVQVAQMVTPVDSWLNSLELVDNQAVSFLDFEETFDGSYDLSIGFPVSVWSG